MHGHKAAACGATSGKTVTCYLRGGGRPGFNTWPSTNLDLGLATPLCSHTPKDSPELTRGRCTNVDTSHQTVESKWVYRMGAAN